VNHRETSERLAAALARSFAEVLRWVEVDEDHWSRRPPGSEWTVAEICEHLALTHHFLLILADKIRDRALKRRAAGEVPHGETSHLDGLEALLSSARPWPAPEHMIPRGERTRSEIRTQLEEDRARCLALLRELPDGEGTLHTIRFSPADAHLDLYQFLGVIDVHLRRHVAQMQRT
jgi:hypothetical protein